MKRIIMKIRDMYQVTSHEINNSIFMLEDMIFDQLANWPY